MLQVSNDALTQKGRSFDDIQHLLVVVFEECKLETILSRVERDSTRAGRAIKTMDGLALDTGEIDRIVQSANDSMIT